jgi:hypothetical protein
MKKSLHLKYGLATTITGLILLPFNIALPMVTDTNMIVGSFGIFFSSLLIGLGSYDLWMYMRKND